MISFASKITRRLLAYFFINESEALYVNEMTAKLNVDKRNLVKKIRELENLGLLNSHFQGNQKYYSLNKSFALYHEYKKVFLKTIGLEQRLQKELKAIKGIVSACIYGSYAQDSMDVNSDIDMLVVGTHDTINLQKNIVALQKETGRVINVTNMDLQEFEDKKKRKDPLIVNLLGKNIVKII